MLGCLAGLLESSFCGSISLDAAAAAGISPSTSLGVGVPIVSAETLDAVSEAAS